MPESVKKKMERVLTLEKDLLLYEKEGYNYFNGCTVLQRLDNIDKHFKARRYRKLTIEQYVDFIYNWLLINPKAYSILAFYEHLENMPFAFTFEEVKAFNSEKINNLLRERIIQSALAGDSRYQFATEALQDLYGWRDKKQDVEDSNEEIEIKF